MFFPPAFRLAPRAISGSRLACVRMYSSSGSSKPSSGSPSRGGSLAVQSSSSTRRKAGYAGSGSVENGTWDQGNLPSVPNTEHLHPAEVAASSFFALHRPLSIKHVIPQVHSTTAFNAIFDPISITQDSKTTPAVSLPAATNSPPGTPSPSSFTTHQAQPRPTKTIERTIIGDLGSLVSSIKDNWATGSFQQSSLATSVNRASATSRGQEGEFPAEDDFSARLFPLSFNSHIPFHPPPPPTPLTAESNAENARPQRQLITIHQTIYPNGMMMMTARSKTIAPITSPYMQRVRERQREHMEQWQNRVIEEAEKAGVLGEQVSDVDVGDAGVGDRAMHAISVKRQRKLKMKKHKYKKLMAKTRNLRRRLEKQ